jgi:hypothetical protein
MNIVKDLLPTADLKRYFLDISSHTKMPILQIVIFFIITSCF